jgi:predicted ester cyclase
MRSCAGVVMTLLLVVAGPAGYAEDVEQNKRVIRRLYDELFSKWNFAVVDELISPDFIGHEMPPGMPRGPEGIRQFYGAIRAGLPDVRLTVEDIMGEGDKVVVRWRARATHRGDFRGIPPTGKPVSFTGNAIYRLSKGKVAERWVEVDLLGLTEQMRAPAAAAGPADAVQAPAGTTDQQTAAAPACDSIRPSSLFGPQPNIGSYSGCMAPANCVAGNPSAVVAIGNSYCTRHHDATCDPGSCTSPQRCKAEYSVARSNGVSVFACGAVADPNCPAGQQRCTCSVAIAAGGQLACGCECKTP